MKDELKGMFIFQFVFMLRDYVILYIIKFDDLMEFMKVLLNLNFFYKILGDKNKRIFLKLVLGNFDNYKKMRD